MKPDLVRAAISLANFTRSVMLAYRARGSALVNLLKLQHGSPLQAALDR